MHDLRFLKYLTDRLNRQNYYLNSPTSWGIIPLSIFTDCSGGNSSPSHPADAGGCNFMEMHRRPYLVPLLVFLLLGFTGKLIVDQVASLPTRLINAASNQATVDAGKIRDAFVDLFQLQPKISVNQTAVFDQTKTALELVVMDQDTQVTRDSAETWFGSTKTIRIHATYRVKAGFDLSKKLEITVVGQEVNIKVPKATILSVEPLSITVDELNNGLWNKIQPQDIDRELQKMPELARAKAAALPDEAEQTFERLLSERLGDLHLHIQRQLDAGPEN